MRDLSGRCAVVTGAGSGIGAALVRRLADQGMNVVLADVAIDDARQVAGEIGPDRTLVVQCEGRQVTTIEGIAPSDTDLHPVQEALIRHDAFQCGYCTPGQIVSAVACIAEGHATSEAEVREWMSGNICRCGAYPQITAAVLDAASRMGGGDRP